MIPFDNKEWNERIEAVRDSMAYELKADDGFEVDNTKIYLESNDGMTAISVNIDIVGSFTNLTKEDSVIAAILKNYPYKEVITFMHNIYSIDVNTGHDDTIRICKENGKMWAWDGCLYEVNAKDNPKEVEEIKEIMAIYTPFIKNKLTNWLNNIRNEYIMKLSKEYWTLREESFLNMCKKEEGAIFK